MENLLVSWALNHTQFFEGLATGWALAHVPTLTLYAFRAAMRVPWLRAAVVAHPDQAKAVINQIAAELDKDIDQEAKTAAAGDAKVEIKETPKP